MVIRSLAKRAHARGSRCTRLAAPLTICLLVAHLARGEDVRLLNGDLLRAPIVERHDVVVVEHPVLGRLVIPRDKIKSIKPTTTPGAEPP